MRMEVAVLAAVLGRGAEVCSRVDLVLAVDRELAESSVGRACRQSVSPAAVLPVFHLVASTADCQDVPGRPVVVLAARVVRRELVPSSELAS
jgi:hypothetical protein